MVRRGRRLIAPWRSVLLLLVALGALAALEFRWIGQARDAERQRMQSYLDASLSRFHDDLHGELVRLAGAFSFDPDIASPQNWEGHYASKYAAWVAASREPALVAALWFVLAGPRADDRAFRLNRATVHFERVPIDSAPEALRGYLPLLDTDGRPRTRPRPPFTWYLEDRSPLLLDAVFEFDHERGGGRHGRPRLLGYAALELSREAIARRLLPALVARNFAGPAGYHFEVSIFAPESGETPVFQSNPSSIMTVKSPADRVASLFEMPPERAAGLGTTDEEAHRQRLASPAIAPGRATGSWRVLIRHPAGSLEAAVAKTYERNLALSLGVMALLAGALAVLLIWAHRARRLAKMQMDFMTSVSHELRTPLAVLASAGDNLAAGAVKGEKHTAQYGVMIRGEARRLTALVEQILHYSAVESGRQQFQMRELPIGPIVREVVTSLKEAAEAEGYTIEVCLDDDLPPVRVDSDALGQCLRNLIANAMKYGGDARWVAVRVSRHDGVRISVEDRGLGIDPDDLPHLFEPFYRGRNAVAAQIHGTGLGLSLARDIVEAMGGKLEVESAPGDGSRFCLVLPAVSEAQTP